MISMSMGALVDSIQPELFAQHRENRRERRAVERIRHTGRRRRRAEFRSRIELAVEVAIEAGPIDDHSPQSRRPEPCQPLAPVQARLRLGV